MKKCRCFFLIGLILILLLLSGCSFSMNQESEEEEKNQKSIDVWTCYDRNVPGAYYVFLWDTLAEEYGYRVDVKSYSEQEIERKLKMAMVSNELPDIFYVPGGSYPEFIFESGACIPVEDYIQDSDFKETYTMPYSDGHNYVIPAMPQSYGVVYYDKTVMDEIGLEVPHSWDELLNLVIKVNEYNLANGTDYAAIEMGEKDYRMGEMLYSMLEENLLSVSPEELEYEQMKYESPMYETIFNAMLQLRDMNAFPDNFIEVGEAEAVKKFIHHDAVMMFHQSSLIYHLTQNMGRDGFIMNVFPTLYPIREGEFQKLVELYHGFTPGLAISSRSQNREVSIQMSVEFANRVNQINVEEFGYLNITDHVLAVPERHTDSMILLSSLDLLGDKNYVYMKSMMDEAELDRFGSMMKQFLSGRKNAQDVLEMLRQ